MRLICLPLPGFSTTNVLSLRDRLKVQRIAAGAISTKMIEIEARSHWPD